jgi:hypothetical protein
MIKNIIITVLAAVVLATVVYFGFMKKDMSPIEKGNPQQAGKIDPRVACNSALAYMTFPAGGAAEVFVQECIEGKHPEVIERYKADLGIDASAQI